MEDIKIINKNLLRYGVMADGRPRFRVVWSTDQVEKVFGDFDKQSGDLYLGTDRSVVREVKKYALAGVLLADRWILEELDFTPSSVLVDSEKGHYEPRWVFRTREGWYQAPIWKAVEYLVKRRLARVERGDARTVKNQEERDDADYMQEVINMLDVESDTMAALHIGEGIVVPSNYNRG